MTLLELSHVDGSYLLINEDGTMKMVSNMGHPIHMEDGRVMELENGDLVMMKNGLLWSQGYWRRR